MIGLVAALFLAATSEVDAVRQLDAPDDVKAFVDRRMRCNHFWGEEPYDADRARDLEAALRELMCERLDEDEQELRRIYAGDPRVLQVLTETADWLW